MFLRNFPAITTKYCLDLNYSDSKPDSPDLFRGSLTGAELTTRIKIGFAISRAACAETTGLNFCAIGTSQDIRASIL